eukprot:Gregarina_sp_Poly_1__3172@NODE_18_length_21885_cov_39_980383_g16_i0_p3_GENE_NODE_18_length_21885_cov_39_980383_g16_i0NODE_18_length_21885_cov_39_980383_g16_i0_p3_ORF_typecomplete_len557_score44_60_NODE_18_length_21885_cov_39_980383_g16_i017423412
MSVGVVSSVRVYSDYFAEAWTSGISPAEAAHEFFRFLEGASLLHSTGALEPPSESLSGPQGRHVYGIARRLTIEIDAALGSTSSATCYGIDINPWSKIDAACMALSAPYLGDSRKVSAYQTVLSYPITATIIRKKLSFFQSLEECERHARAQKYDGQRPSSSSYLRLSEFSCVKKLVSCYLVCIPHLTESVYVAFECSTNVTAKRSRISALSTLASEHQINSVAGSLSYDRPPHKQQNNDNAEQPLDSYHLLPSSQGFGEPDMKCHQMEMRFAPVLGSLMLFMTSTFRNLKIQQLLSVHSISYVRIGSPKFYSSETFIALAERGGTLIPRLQMTKIRDQRSRPTIISNCRNVVSRVCRSLGDRRYLCSNSHDEEDDQLPGRDGIFTSLEFDETHRRTPQPHIKSMPAGLLENEKPPTAFRLKSYSSQPPHDARLSFRTRLTSRLLSSTAETEAEDSLTYLNQRIIDWLGYLQEATLESARHLRDIRAKDCRILSVYMTNNEYPMIIVTAGFEQTSRVLQALSLTHYFLERTLLPLSVSSALATAFRQYSRAEQRDG